MKSTKNEATKVATVKNLRGEEWKTVRGYGTKVKYQVSTEGRIKSINRNSGSEKLLVQEKTVGGYLRVTLQNKAGRNVHERVHRLSAKAFHKNTKRKPQVNHKNGNGRDNRATNLEWVTAKENVAHAVANGYMSTGKKPVSRIAKNGKVKRFESLSQASRMSNTNTPSIKAVLDGSHKTAGGYRWKF